MHELICPKCGQSFTVDNEGYASILQQVRTEEFNKDLEKRTSEQSDFLKEKFEKDIQLRLNEAEKNKNEEISKLNIEIQRLNSTIEQNSTDFELTLQKSAADRDNEITKLREQLANLAEKAELTAKDEVNKAVSEKDSEISKLNIEIQRLNSTIEQNSTDFELTLQKSAADRDNEITKLREQLANLAEKAELTAKDEVNKAVSEKESEISKLNIEIQRLKADAEQSENRQAIAVNDAVNAEKQQYESRLEAESKELNEKNIRIIELENELKNKENEFQLELRDKVSEIEKERDIRYAQYESDLKAQNEKLEYYKDMKTRLSTKMVGESLEKHCENQFNIIRMTAFRNAEFEKDNTVTDGSKGDYIYRECDDDGTEIISIMFEMKNEMDTTATKHKNEDFFAKLDKDRINKKCEYAVLVSMLEADNELYNTGIVDVSYKYEKMYVIRPQFFIPMITILRNAAMNTLQYKRQLTEMRNQDIDITHFEEKIEDFKKGFSRNYDLASKQFDEAIKEIDKSIAAMTKVKEKLESSLNNLRLANDKAQKQLTIKSLTKGNETMIEMFGALENEE